MTTDPITQAREAAERYLDDQTKGGYLAWPDSQTENAIQDFVAGAEWQASRAPQPTEDYTAPMPRWMHRLYAQALGYFWLPCGRCGRHFGGHERGWRPREAGTSEPILCPRCAPQPTEEAREARIYYDKNAFDRFRDENPGWHQGSPFSIAEMFWRAGEAHQPTEAMREVHRAPQPTEDGDYDSELAVMLSQMLDYEPMWSCVVIAKRLHAAGFRRAPAEPAVTNVRTPTPFDPPLTAAEAGAYWDAISGDTAEPVTGATETGPGRPEPSSGGNDTVVIIRGAQTGAQREGTR